MHWQPISTAPKNKNILLWVSAGPYIPAAGMLAVGKWDPDSYSQVPKPYWATHLVHTYGVRDTRKQTITHWCEIVGPDSEKQ